MPLSFSALCSIADRASTLAECTENAFQLRAPNLSVARRRLARWRQLASGPGSRDSSDRPGSKDLASWPVERILALLGQVERSATTTLPPWSDTLLRISRAVSDAFSGPSSIKHSRRLPPALEHVFPFVHLYWPMTDLAWRGVEAAGVIIPAQLSRAARMNLTRLLLCRLSEVASPALQILFQVELACDRVGMFSPQPEPAAVHLGDNHQTYLRFVHAEGCAGLDRLFTRYPVAARLVALCVERWQQSVTELLQRLEQDRAALALHFNSGCDLGRIVSIQGGLSDAHRGGRSVLILTTASGLRLVYKPRSLRVDALFNELVGSLNSRLGDDRLRTLAVLDRGEYGWMEYIHPEGCADESAGRRYARRAGVLICLAYWLQAVDCHRENLIAAGEHPVLVDLEALAHPVAEGASTSYSGQLPALEHSVMCTDLLPLGNPGDDRSGLCAPIKWCHQIPVLRWKRINTDAMEVSAKKSVLRGDRHRLRVGGRCVDLRRFENDLLEGYCVLVPLLTDVESLVAQRCAKAIWRARRRRIKRPTLLYRTLLLRSLAPARLADGVEHSIELEALPCASGDEQEWAEEVFEMERLDVPYFETEVKDDVNPTLPDRDNLLAQCGIIRLSLRRKLVLREGQIALAQHGIK